jgi:hypothetical protein
MRKESFDKKPWMRIIAAIGTQAVGTVGTTLFFLSITAGETSTSRICGSSNVGSKVVSSTGAVETAEILTSSDSTWPSDISASVLASILNLNRKR